MNLKISTGKAIDNKKDIYLNLAKNNIHTIVFSGQTGSGKSTFHHSITKQIIKNNTPKEVGFIFMDFKRVEFGQYKDSDYLYHPIVYDPEEAITVLKDLIHESNKRYKADVFTPELFDHSNLKGWFVPGGDWYKYYDEEINAYSSRILGHVYKNIPKPWTRVFQLKSKKEIICKGYE